ncbi:DNA-processing protein DprA [Halalkalibacter kiskunsagensis]|uniref:DNA-processing protein DprA n=1 Tax=Halalkalibacter kiskunsagensis TaxID=1548599 RepID=A0ABV6KGF3_9BACI
MPFIRERLVHVHSCSDMSRSLLRNILFADPDLQKIYGDSVSDLQTQFKIPHSKALSIYKYLRATSPEQLLAYFDSKNIFTITILDSDYPLLLKEIYDPPLVLYGMGLRTILASEKRLAVVGTRAPTSIGVQTISKLIPAISRNDWTIVSGFARGIDSLAHWQTINASGKTIAVLGSGLSYLYPKENFDLFSQMSKNHLILSEYPPNTPPQKWHFPARNRVISGLCKAVLVIEAKERSGSLITADQALEQGRDVFAIPGSIFSSQSKGTNLLIQQGAKLVLHEEDILQELQEH